MATLNSRTVTHDFASEFQESQRNPLVFINGMPRNRVRATGPLCDCLAMAGQLHVHGCKYEQCPNCQGLLTQCGCLNGD